MKNSTFKASPPLAQLGWRLVLLSASQSNSPGVAPSRPPGTPYRSTTPCIPVVKLAEFIGSISLGRYFTQLNVIFIKRLKLLAYQMGQKNIGIVGGIVGFYNFPDPNSK